MNNLIQGENSKKKNKHKKVEWSSECQEAFEELKRLCTTTPVLAYADYKKWFKVSTDASEKGTWCRTVSGSGGWYDHG